MLPSLPPRLLPQVICQRLIDFMSRMAEVKDPESQEEVTRALFEIRRVMVYAATGVELEVPDVVVADNHDQIRAMVTLLREGSIPLYENNLAILDNVNACIDCLFHGVDHQAALH